MLAWLGTRTRPSAWRSLNRAKDSTRGGQELEHLAVQFANDSGAGELLPPALGLAVVHDEIAVAQLAGGAEIEHPAVEPPVEHDRRVAERTVGHGNRRAAHRVVHDLVPDQDAQGVRAGILSDLHADDRFGVREVLGFGERHEFGIVYRRYPVLRRSARHDLGKRDGVPREIGLRPERLPEFGIGHRRSGEQEERRGAPDGECAGENPGCFHHGPVPPERHATPKVGSSAAIARKRVLTIG